MIDIVVTTTRRREDGSGWLVTRQSTEAPPEAQSYGSRFEAHQAKSSRRPLPPPTTPPTPPVAPPQVRDEGPWDPAELDRMSVAHDALDAQVRADRAANIDRLVEELPGAFKRKPRKQKVHQFDGTLRFLDAEGRPVAVTRRYRRKPKADPVVSTWSQQVQELLDAGVIQPHEVALLAAPDEHGDWHQPEPPSTEVICL